MDAGKTTQLEDPTPSETPTVFETPQDPSVATITEPQQQTSESVPQLARYEKVVLEPTSTLDEVRTNEKLLYLITHDSPVEEDLNLRIEMKMQGLKRHREFTVLEKVDDEEEDETHLSRKRARTETETSQSTVSPFQPQIDAFSLYKFVRNLWGEELFTYLEKNG